MFLKDLAITALPNSKYSFSGFNVQTVCMEDMYLRNLLPYKNNFISKLNILLVGEDDRDTFKESSFQYGEFSQNISIGEIFTVFDFNSYYASNEHDKKLKILNKIQEGFLIFAKQKDVSMAPFNDAYEKCLVQNLINRSLYKEATSRNNNLTVRVFIEMDLNLLQVVGVFYDNTEHIISEKLFFSREPEAMYSYYLGNVKWINENEVTLFGRSKDEFWTINL